MRNFCLSSSFAVLLIFVTLFVVGYAIHGDFGIPTDELWLRELGLVSAKYVADSLGISYPANSVYAIVPDLADYPDGDHGSIFELLYILVESFFNIQNIAEGYRLKQLLIFWTALLGMFSVYSLAKRRFNDKAAGLIALLLMILSPRIFADSFYNAKDLVFMALFAIAMNTMIVFLKNKNIISAFLYGLVTAIAFDIRIAAIIFPLLTTILISIDFFRTINERAKIARAYIIYIITICIFIPLFWPWLWIDLFGNLQKAFQSAVSFERLIAWILFRGFYYPTDGLPWYYLPNYIIVTTPIVHIILFIVGGFYIFRSLIKHKFLFWNDVKATQDLLCMGFFFGPLLLSMFLKPVLYNGWRHFYFLYPAFVLIATVGVMSLISTLKNNLIIKYFLLTMIFASLFNVSIWMVRNHPIGNNYFNSLIGSNWRLKYDIDYWGLSTYVALKYILENDNRTSIKVKPLQCINAAVSMKLFSQVEQDRLILVYDDEVADYMLLNYMFLDPSQHALWEKIKYKFPVFHNLKVDDEIILSIVHERRSDTETLPISQTGFRICER